MKKLKIINIQSNFECKMSNFVVSIVPADGLALSDTRPSAGKVMAQNLSYRLPYMTPALEFFFFVLFLFFVSFLPALE